MKQNIFIVLICVGGLLGMAGLIWPKTQLVAAGLLFTDIALLIK